MVAPENEAVACAADDRVHAAAVGLDAGRARVVEPPAVHRTPEVRVELEVRAAPFGVHDVENALQVRLRLDI